MNRRKAQLVLHGLGREQRSPSAGALNSAVRCSGRVLESSWSRFAFQFRSLAAGSISEFQKHFEPWFSSSVK